MHIHIYIICMDIYLSLSLSLSIYIYIYIYTHIYSDGPSVTSRPGTWTVACVRRHDYNLSLNQTCFQTYVCKTVIIIDNLSKVPPPEKIRPFYKLTAHKLASLGSTLSRLGTAQGIPRRACCNWSFQFLESCLIRRLPLSGRPPPGSSRRHLHKQPQKHRPRRGRGSGRGQARSLVRPPHVPVWPPGARGKTERRPKEVWGSSPRLGGWGVSPFQVSGGKAPCNQGPPASRAPRRAFRPDPEYTWD